MKIKIVLAACISVAAAYTHAAVIQVNFGSAAVDAPTNSPYHTVNGAFTDTTWNQVNGIVEINPGVVPNPGALLNSDGTSATGVSMVFGSSLNSLVADFTAPPDQSRNLNNSQSAIYQLSTMESGIWNGGNTAGQINLVATRVDGLAAGTYDVYVWGLFGNMNNNNFNDGKAAKLFYAEAGSTAASLDISSLESMTGDDPVNAPGAQSVGTWTSGTNYAVATITVGAGESLYVVGSDAVLGGNDDQFRGVLSGLQIVAAVPEPTTYALFLGLAGLGIVMIRRHRSRR